MEATLQTVSSTMTVIRDLGEIAAALKNELTVSGKWVLVTKGNDTAKTVEYVYRAFAEHKDLHGEHFMLSRQHKGLVHRDKWGCISKVNNYDFEKYLEHWFCFAELITSGEGTHLKISEESPALALKQKCPRFSAQIWQQRRWLHDSTLALFQWNDL